MKISTTVVALVVLLSGGSAGAASPFSSLIVFGDSLSDVGDNPSGVNSLYKELGGNCDPLHPCLPSQLGPSYDGGRFSNGPVASEYLAKNLFPAGVNTANFQGYAVAGATSGNHNVGNDADPTGILNLPGMQQEVNLYLSNAGGAADPNALYFVWGGSNDYLIHDSPVQAARNIGSYVNVLAAAGARNFLVPNLPDLGLTPSARMDNEVSLAHDYSVVFNTELASQLGSLDGTFPGLNIQRFDTFSLLNDVVQNPMNYGLTDVTNPCFTLLGVTCDNPEVRLFWDDFHPTTNAHAILGAAFAAAVPEPATIFMFMLGLLVLASTAGRRQKTMPARRQVQVQMSK
ncbi:SGNH/GDSL hydrolase family protein [Nitrosospira multiformis]|nr:SGNH/GDSL hydrolase family protein [Nitrosospira multiformis]SEA24807.1 PEP-CTERM protein-sorting domain-containing protein [Nitrosospira multiformis]